MNQLTAPSAVNQNSSLILEIPNPVLRFKNTSIWYGTNEAVKSVSMGIKSNAITAIIGPSGCGKSTLLRSINRMNDLIPDCHVTGNIYYHNNDIYDKNLDPVLLRRHIGMVFQKPNPFAKSIYQNIAWGAKINGYKGNLDQLVEESLQQAALWDEVKDKLHKSAYALSGGQQQRLCIARAIALKPDILLLDEPTSALDPISTAKIESLLEELKNFFTIIIVTHNMQQAGRISDYTAFMLTGDLIEYNETKKIFFNPTDERTESYISGRFG